MIQEQMAAPSAPAGTQARAGGRGGRGGIQSGARERWGKRTAGRGVVGEGYSEKKGVRQALAMVNHGDAGGIVMICRWREREGGDDGGSEGIGWVEG